MPLTGASRRGAASLAASGEEHTARATRSAVNSAGPAAAHAENPQAEVGGEQACHLAAAISATSNAWHKKAQLQKVKGLHTIMAEDGTIRALSSNCGYDTT